MPLVLTIEGKLRLLNSIVLGTPIEFYIGLYSNPATLDQWMTLVQLGVCNFSGYVGLQWTGVFGSAALIGERAIATSGILTWTHDGGPIGQWVYGYYAVDGAGELVWASARSEGPMAMSVLGQSVSVTPAISLRSEFGG